jgi:hypothetical protein
MARPNRACAAVLVGLALTGCTHSVAANRTNVTIAARDATELYPLRDTTVHIRCTGTERAVSARTDAHGRMRVQLPRGERCELTASWKDDKFLHAFDTNQPTLTLVLLSRWSFILHGVPFEPAIQGVRVPSSTPLLPQ